MPYSDQELASLLGEEEEYSTDSWWNKAKNMGKAAFMGGADAAGQIINIPKTGYEMIGKSLWGYDPLDPTIGSSGEMAKEAILPKGPGYEDEAIGVGGTMQKLGIPGGAHVKGAERATLGFLTDLGTDPTLPLDVAYKPAMALLTAGMAKGTIESASDAKELLKKEGLSPDAVEAIVSSLFSATGLALGGAGLARRGPKADTAMKPIPEDITGSPEMEAKLQELVQGLESEAEGVLGHPVSTRESLPLLRKNLQHPPSGNPTFLSRCCGNVGNGAIRLDDSPYYGLSRLRVGVG